MSPLDKAKPKRKPNRRSCVPTGSIYWDDSSKGTGTVKRHRVWRAEASEESNLFDATQLLEHRHGVRG